MSEELIRSECCGKEDGNRRSCEDISCIQVVGQDGLLALEGSDFDYVDVMGKIYLPSLYLYLSFRKVSPSRKEWTQL
jgi:hypothetical protein